MTQPADFYQKKYEALKSLKLDLGLIINTAYVLSEYEQSNADHPDTIIYDYMVQQAKLEIKRIEHSLANVERLMNE